MKKILGTIIFLLSWQNASANISNGYLCASDTASTRVVVRAVTDYGMTLSKFSKHEKIYNDVSFNIEDTSFIEGEVTYTSDTRSPDGDETTVILKVNHSEAGTEGTVKWLGIEFPHLDTELFYSGVIYLNDEKPLGATCIELI